MRRIRGLLAAGVVLVAGVVATPALAAATQAEVAVSASTANAERTWTGPTVLSVRPQTGQTELFPVAAGPTGLVLMKYSPPDRAYQYSRKTLTGGWSEFRTVATDATGPLVDSAAVAADATTARFVLPIGNQNTTLRYQVDDGTQTTQSITLGAGSSPAITIGLDGTSVVAARTATGIDVWRITAAGVVSGPATVGPNTATTQSVDPRIVTGPQGAIILVWANGQDCDPEGPGFCSANKGKTLSWSRYQADGWTPPAALDTGGPISFVTGFDGNHTQAVLAWFGSSSGNLTYRNGAWGPAEFVSPDAGPSTGVVAVSAAGDATIANNSGTYTRFAGTTSWVREAPIPGGPIFCSKGGDRIAYLSRDLHAFVAEANREQGTCMVNEFQLRGTTLIVPPVVIPNTAAVCSVLQTAQTTFSPQMISFLPPGFLASLMRSAGCSGA